MKIREEKCNAINDYMSWRSNECKLLPDETEDFMWVRFALPDAQDDLTITFEDACTLYDSMRELFVSIEAITGVKF